MRHLLVYLPEIFLPARCDLIVVSAVVGAKLRTKGCDELTSVSATPSTALLDAIIFSA